MRLPCLQRFTIDSNSRVKLQAYGKYVYTAFGVEAGSERLTIYADTTPQFVVDLGGCKGCINLQGALGWLVGYFEDNLTEYENYRSGGGSGGSGGGGSASGLCFRNRRSDGHRIWVSVGYLRNSQWVSEGWWGLSSGDKKCPLGGSLTNRYYYYYADVQGGGRYSGSYGFWVHPTNAFGPIADSLERSVAESRGYEWTGFREIDTEDYRSYTVNLTQ